MSLKKIRDLLEATSDNPVKAINVGIDPFSLSKSKWFRKYRMGGAYWGGNPGAHSGSESSMGGEGGSGGESFEQEGSVLSEVVKDYGSLEHWSNHVRARHGNDTEFYHEESTGKTIATKNKTKVGTFKHNNKTPNDLTGKGMVRPDPALSEGTAFNPKVHTDEYSWGKMKTIRHGNQFSIPLHPEHQEGISKLKDEESHSFKDETGKYWVAKRLGDDIHFSHNGDFKSKVPLKDLKEMKNDPCWKGYEMVGTKNKEGKEVPSCVPVKETLYQNKKVLDVNKKGKCNKLSEVSKSTLASYINKAARNAVDNGMYGVNISKDSKLSASNIDLANSKFDTSDKRLKGIKKATEKLTEAGSDKELFLDKGDWLKKAESLGGYVSGNTATHVKHGTIGSWNKNAGEGYIYHSQIKESVDIFQDIYEKMDPNAELSDWIKDFQNSKDNRFYGKTKEERTKQAIAAYYDSKKNEEITNESIDDDFSGISSLMLDEVNKATMKMYIKKSVIAAVKKVLDVKE